MKASILRLRRVGKPETEGEKAILWPLLDKENAPEFLSSFQNGTK